MRVFVTVHSVAGRQACLQACTGCQAPCVLAACCRLVACHHSMVHQARHTLTVCCPNSSSSSRSSAAT